jgi:hypothetical protein
LECPDFGVLCQGEFCLRGYRRRNNHTGCSPLKKMNDKKSENEKTDLEELRRKTNRNIMKYVLATEIFLTKLLRFC